MGVWSQNMRTFSSHLSSKASCFFAHPVHAHDQPPGLLRRFQDVQPRLQDPGVLGGPEGVADRAFPFASGEAWVAQGGYAIEHIEGLGAHLGVSSPPFPRNYYYQTT